MSDQPVPVTPEPDFWAGLQADADTVLAEANVSPSQVITISTPTGQMITVPVEIPTSISDLIVSQSLSISPAATFLVDGQFVPKEYCVAPGGHVVVSVPLKGG